MGEIIIDFTEPPIQSLMNYVFKNYRELEGFCEIEGKSKDPAECGNCHRNSYFGGAVLNMLATTSGESTFLDISRDSLRKVTL